MLIRVISTFILVMISAATPLNAAVRIETQVGTETVYLISDVAQDRVLISRKTESKLIDLRNQVIYLLVPGLPPRRIDATRLARATGLSQRPSIERIGPGARIANYPTTRFRLSVGGQVCSIIDANLGLNMALGPAMRAFVLLDRLNAIVGGPHQPECQKIPYARYKSVGWALRVKDPNGPLVEAVSIDKYFRPPEGLLDLPTGAEDITDQILAAGARETSATR